MKINDEGTSNAAHWHERAMKAEARLADADALLREVRDAYWLETTRTSLPSDPPDELLARLDDFLRGAGGSTKGRNLLVLARDYIEANQGGWCRDGVGSTIILKHIDAHLARK